MKFKTEAYFVITCYWQTATDSNYPDDTIETRSYLSIYKSCMSFENDIEQSKKFDTYEEAEKWLLEEYCNYTNAQPAILQIEKVYIKERIIN